jgi:hypothetical protein
MMAVGGGRSPTQRSRAAGSNLGVSAQVTALKMQLPFRRWLLTSWWHMKIEDLIIEGDARGYLENRSDLDAFIVTEVDNGEIYYGCAINPDIDPDREFGALDWCAQLVTRIEDLGFHEAMKTDAWQYRSDGRWELWGRVVDLPPHD